MKFAFFLGGNDLEMDRIREILGQEVERRHGAVALFDGRLGQGAKASAYRAEIESSIKQGFTPVLVELERDFSPAVSIDLDPHRPGAAPAPTILMVSALLHRALERDDYLVAAYDMKSFRLFVDQHVTPEEFKALHAKDLLIRGVSSPQEKPVELKAWCAAGI